ncbi:nitrous oxide reductase accessory protein NosL [Aquimarina hainanensis]|uniref:Nitrous oxide reductase accessory protein NosL n=1 Tax=Aquimarina hainanensis TaxID=1578017 RepID=A0ABW5NCM6_9FLAO|nr:nitrous oxide reductase accessory protein NosL [Aquimarina sp. TRL1]QKX04008.1 hypothetical protein HN014_03515 [Aquimarina sp. TRL1]
MKKVLFISFISILLTSCNTGPKPIHYGTDMCYSCTMTIVDKRHAAEIVTRKGKVFKFDATECMINHIKTVDTSSIGSYLTVDYTKPELLIDATKATFLITEQIPSPMGAYLSAFENPKDADSVQAKKGGNIYSWNKLLSTLKNNTQ